MWELKMPLIVVRVVRGESSCSSEPESKRSLIFLLPALSFVPCCSIKLLQSNAGPEKTIIHSYFRWYFFVISLSLRAWILLVHLEGESRWQPPVRLRTV